MYYRRHSKTCQFEKVPLAKTAKVRGKIIQELLLILKFLKKEPKVKSLTVDFYDLYYTFKKNMFDKDKEEVEDNSDTSDKLLGGEKWGFRSSNSSFFSYINGDAKTQMWYLQYW